MVLPNLETTSNISISKRDLPPADYLFKIKPYPSSMEIKEEKYESDVFEAGDYTWKLVLYPTGHSNSSGSGSGKVHVSLYLAITNTEKLSRGWEVNVNFKLFLLDQNNNNYLTIQDGDGVVRKFNEMKSEWGFEQLILVEDLLDSYNGFFVDESCVFGAEVFVIRHSDKWESLYLVNDPPQVSLTLKLDRFKSRPYSYISVSKSFIVGERDWKFKVIPMGFDVPGINGNYLSIILLLTDWKKFPSKRAVNASVKIKILDQINNKNYEKIEKLSYNELETEGRDLSFISLNELNKEENGYIKDDVLIMEVEIFKISII